MTTMERIRRGGPRAFLFAMIPLGFIALVGVMLLTARPDYEATGERAPLPEAAQSESTSAEVAAD